MIQRLKLWGVCILIALDQLFHCIIGGPKYILFGGMTPNPDETISSKVGRAALAGKRWALACQWCINLVFGKNHCLNSIGT
jgi:hypothetical protein